MSSPLRNPRLQLMLVIGLITASGFWVWWFASYQPQIEKIEVLVEHENRLRVGNQEARRTVAALGLDRIREAIESYDQQAEHVAALVPPDTVVFDVRARVEQTAEALEVNVINIDLLPEETDGDFAVRTYRIRASGGYHDVAALMTELLSLPRITRISNAEVRQAESGAAGRAVEATFVLAVYFTRTTSAEPPARPATKEGA